MKKNLLRIYLLGFFLLSDFMLFAQPGDNDEGGGLEDDDAPASPINGKIVWLVVVAILYGMYTFNKNRKKA